MLSVPAMKAALQKADEMFDSEATPFRKVNSLHIICCKAHTQDRIHFAVTMIMQLVKSNVWSLSELGTRKIKGMDGDVSVIEYFNMVKDIKDRFLNEHIYQFGWAPANIETVRAAFTSYIECRGARKSSREAIAILSPQISIVDVWANCVYIRR